MPNGPEWAYFAHNIYSTMGKYCPFIGAHKELNLINIYFFCLSIMTDNFYWYVDLHDCILLPAL